MTQPRALGSPPIECTSTAWGDSTPSSVMSYSQRPSPSPSPFTKLRNRTLTSIGLGDSTPSSVMSYSQPVFINLTRSPLRSVPSMMRNCTTTPCRQAGERKESR
jgi:hypothetical protein